MTLFGVHISDYSPQTFIAVIVLSALSGTVTLLQMYTPFLLHITLAPIIPQAFTIASATVAIIIAYPMLKLRLTNIYKKHVKKTVLSRIYSFFTSLVREEKNIKEVVYISIIVISIVGHFVGCSMLHNAQNK